MNAKISVLVICAEAIVYLLLHNLLDCTFKCSGGRGYASQQPKKSPLQL